MLSAIRRHLTYANVAATLALVLSMSGAALAANHYLINSTKQIKPSVIRKLRGDTGRRGSTGARGPTGITGPATGAAGGALAGRYPNPTLASGSVGTASFAPTAKAPTAGNSELLGGIPASGYTRSDCASLTGQVRGFAQVNASPSFSTTLIPVSGYNCSGEPIEARRVSEGVYEVRFLGSPVQVAAGNSMGGSADTVSFKVLGPGDFEVLTYNAPAAHLHDDPFFMLTP